MRFLIDAQLPSSLAEAMRNAGFDVLHVADIGLLSATDSEIWEAAVSRSAILVSKDRDFAELRAIRSVGPVVLWLRIGNTTNAALIARMLAAMPAIVEAVKRGEAVIELSRL